MSKYFTAKNIAWGGLIAAVYVVLTIVSAALGISSGFIQIRLSEALCILPVFTPAAVPGLFLGCLIANLITGSVIWDVIFGSLATLLGAVLTYVFRRNRWLASLFPIAANTVIIPFILAWAYHINQAYWLIVLSVFAGEFLSVGVLGQLLYQALKKHGHVFV